MFELLGNPYIHITFLLVFWHFMADYPLQSDFIANAKNHTTDLGKIFWRWVLPGHAMIHAGGVYVITGGSIVLATVELVSHSIIDYLKCGNKITFNQDQLLHMFFKALYVLSLMFVELP